MKSELQNELISKFPEQFKNLSYIQCGDGWYDILYRLCSIVSNRIESHKRMDKLLNFNWSQIKEKFGGLRAYCYGADEYMSGAIDMAESMSYITCEVSGEKGRKRYKKKDLDGIIIPAWVKTLSDSVALDQGYVDVESGFDADESD
jgi:hypothetical protein